MTNKNQTSFKDQELLNQFGTNLVALAKAQKLKPVIGRQQEIKQVLEVLNQMEKNNPILVGEPGVGKSAIVEAIAIAIAQNDVPDWLKSKTIYSINIANLKAGASLFGEFEQRVVGLIKACQADPNVILFIDEIHLLMSAGTTGANSIDLANIFKPALARGELRLIGATTWDEFHQHLENDRAFLRRINPINISAPDQATTLTILKGLKSTYENFHQLFISDEALVKAVSWSNRYLPNQHFPDKAISLIDRAAANLKLKLSSTPAEIKTINEAIEVLNLSLTNLKNDQQSDKTDEIAKINEEIKQLKQDLKPLENAWNQQKSLLKQLKQDQIRFQELKQTYEKLPPGSSQAPDIKEQINQLSQKLANYDLYQSKEQSQVRNWVAPSDVALALSQQAQISLDLLNQDQSQQILNLKAILKQSVIGQDQAIAAITNQLLSAKAGFGFANEQKPLGSFLLVGPPGVGKTLVAKSLASALFGDQNSLIRINMSEMSEAAAISKLIGAPPGYVGYDKNNQFADLVRQKPYSVVLIDEIEKAHPEILNLFLQILDEGQLQDSHNKQVSFKNTIIIMTTNAAADIVSEQPNLNGEQLAKQLHHYFKPEFLDRFNQIIPFHHLNEDQIKAVIDLEIAKLSHNRDGHIVHFSDLVKGYLLLLVNQNPQSGLRIINRHINQTILPIVSQKILNHPDHNIMQLECDVDLDVETLAINVKITKTKPKEAENLKIV